MPIATFEIDACEYLPRCIKKTIFKVNKTKLTSKPRSILMEDKIGIEVVRIYIIIMLSLGHFYEKQIKT